MKRGKKRHPRQKQVEENLPRDTMKKTKQSKIELNAILPKNISLYTVNTILFREICQLSSIINTVGFEKIFLAELILNKTSWNALENRNTKEPLWCDFNNTGHIVVSKVAFFVLLTVPGVKQ